MLTGISRLLTRPTFGFWRLKGCENAKLRNNTSSLIQLLPILQINAKISFNRPTLITIKSKYLCDNANNKKLIIGKETVEYTEFEQFRRDESALIIDVRNPDELLNNGEIPNAINIPLSHISSYFFGENSDLFEEHFGIPLPSSKDPIIVSCKAGVRAEMARKLLSTGSGKTVYTNVARYGGSYDEWSEKNMQIPKAK